MSAESNHQDIRHLQHEADRAKPHLSIPVIGYIAILFAMAFLLLLLSYFMQQRNNKAMLDGLSASVSAMESIDNLRQEKTDLTFRVEELEGELGHTEAELAASRATAERLSNELAAMDWLREIQALYEKQYYRAARAMIAEFEATGLPAHLPDRPFCTYDGVEVLSPGAQYTKITDALD